MRITGLLLVLGLAAVLFGCKNDGDADAAPDPAALKAQEELLARRDALLKARNELQSEKDQLELEIKEAESKGGDTTELRKKHAEVESKLESTTDEALGVLSSKLDAIHVAGGRAAQLAAREAQLAGREKQIAEREARVAERERLLVQRDFESAQRWKESCAAGAAPVIIQPPKGGGNWTKQDVLGQLQKAKKAMASKGLITSDLPSHAQSLESDATKAMNENDTSRAYIFAQQLAGTVEAIRVDRAFIQAKYNRLSAQVGKAADSATNKQYQDLLADVMQKYGDGNFQAANQRLNQLANQLAK